MGMVSGGLRECLKVLNDKITQYKKYRGWLVAGSIYCLVVSGFYFYELYKRTMVAIEMSRAEKDKRERLDQELKMNRFPSIISKEKGFICVICMDNPCNLVCLPCNHLAMCHYCYNDLKSKFQNGDSQYFKCPVCRAPLEEDKFIVFDYKQQNDLEYSQLILDGL